MARSKYKVVDTGGYHMPKITGMKSSLLPFNLPNTKPVKVRKERKGGKRK